MSSIVSFRAAKTDLSRLVDRAAAGEEIVIIRAGKPVARLAPLAAESVLPAFELPRNKMQAAEGYASPAPSPVDDFWSRAAALRRYLEGRNFLDSARIGRDSRRRQVRKFK